MFCPIYLAGGTRADNRNAFDVSRVYLNAASKLDDRYDVFVQLETNLSSRDNTANRTYLKQAWVRWNEIYLSASLRFGLVPAPWRGFEEGMRLLINNNGYHKSRPCTICGKTSDKLATEA